MAQERETGWEPFTREQIEEFYGRKHRDGFSFNKLLSSSWIVEDTDGNFHFTDDFVRRAHASSPAVPREEASEMNTDSFSIILTNENAEWVAGAIESIISQRCTCVTIVASLNNIEVRTSLTAEPLRGGKLVEVDRKGSSAAIRWSIDSSLHPIYASRPENPVRVSLHNGVLTIRHNAPAGHPLVWIYAEEHCNA